MGETARPSPVRVLKALLDLPELLATANFYEKALFVKVDVATVLWLTQPLCPSRYASIRTFGELMLSLVARCIMGSVFSGY
jgi:hypothetical protein